MAIALFISEQYIKDMSYLDENVDVKLIRPVIVEAQEMHILPLIGTGLYNEISTQINAGTLSALNTTLVNTYLAKSLKYWTLYEGIDVFTFKFTNKGILKRTSENGNTIELSDDKRLMARLSDKAEWYDTRVKKYMMENSISYPLYLDPGQGIDTVRPKRQTYRTGIVMGRRPKPDSIADIYENPNTYCD